MKCPIEAEENAEILLAYCARRLDPDTTVVLERHMAGCPACRSFQESQQAVWEALNQWEVQPVSPEFDAKLYERIEAEGRSSWWQRLAGPFPAALIRQGLPIAAAACLLMMAGMIARRPDAPAVPAHTVVRAETVQPEQVERTLDDMELLHQFTVATSDEKDSKGSM